ncbi:MAG: histidine--tRNA ligase [Zymomonas mobilis]|uniref:Histidine--tRNA ligase n=1 Tax=Zymomonas mobilis TaxID=542 RepID=A0A542W2M4_ZYMMB|nr:histidine--tRNA ligase [Zymomonas mobilis]TQL17835.1 histidyl-tRNA synthetase [Zymomonas mobilis]
MKIKTPQPIRGTQDIFGEDSLRFNHVVNKFDEIRQLYGFKRAEIPVFESTAVFARSLGETTDVVSKEMYSFPDRSGEQLTLRPEFTAGLTRAYLTSGWQQYAPCKLVTHGPVFRYERPQKGRYRQFHQIDAEVIGAAEPEADVELLCLADQFLEELGIKQHVTLHLNTLGDSVSREAWRAALIEYFQGHFDSLSQESQERLARNPLRILDSKDPNDKIIAEKAPVIDDYLTEEAATFFNAVTSGLDAAGVAWTRDPRLVRGLDYYRHTAFEFITDQLGAQGTVLAGGRYDGLAEALGGNLTPAIGWAAGIERLAMLIEKPQEDAIKVAVIPLGDESKNPAISILAKLRHAGISADMSWRGNMKRRMQKANGWGVQYAVILGEEELAQNAATVRSMVTGEQQSIALDQIVDQILSELRNK